MKYWTFWVKGFGLHPENYQESMNHFNKGSNLITPVPPGSAMESGLKKEISWEFKS